MRRAVLTIVAVAVVGAAGWYSLHWIPADFSSIQYDEFQTVPDDGHALEKWTRANHHVWLAAENRERVGDHWRVEVIVGMTRNGWGQPPWPDLDAAAAQLGYREAKRGFREVPR